MRQSGPRLALRMGKEGKSPRHEATIKTVPIVRTFTATKCTIKCHLALPAMEIQGNGEAEVQRRK